MLPSDLMNPVYTDADAARAYLESVRWPDGPVCPHCGSVEAGTALKGKAHRAGLYQCRGCGEQYTVTVGTLYERSHIPLNKWLLATHLMCSSKKGISALQLQRNLGLGSYRTAWFMAHRIREGMTGHNTGTMGGSGKTVEADETYLGPRQSGINAKGKRISVHDKMKVVALVERGGRARSFHVENVDRKTVHTILARNVTRDTALMTDEAKHYVRIGQAYASHDAVNHARGEYVRDHAHTNTIEGYFSIFKRGMKGVYQHCSEKHLHRYLAEFDFRYSERIALGVDDAMRANKALKGIEGKRLTYRRTRRQESQAQA